MKYSLFILCFIISHLIKGQQTPAGADKSDKARHVHFIPASFSNKFSLNITPVLKIHPGDTVSTETIDALGFDKNGVKRQRGGNPLTGPFFIENSMAGDILAITLTNVSLNRPYAYTTETFVSRSLPKDIIKQLKKFHLVKWKLDIEKGFAFPDSSYMPYDHLKNFKVPLKPFLGCIGVAPSSKNNEVLSFFQGSYGGNLDFNRVAQSATVYLPVFHDGGYLYIGDGHALQGDGEIAGNALETSLNVEFTVTLIKKDSLQLTVPRIDDSTYIMAIGMHKSLEGALKIATAEILGWLRHDYHLSLLEATQVISTTIEYTIAEIADPQVEVVAKIKKEILRGLTKYK